MPHRVSTFLRRLTIVTLTLLLLTSATAWLLSYFLPASAVVTRDSFRDTNWTARSLTLDSSAGGLHLTFTSAHAHESDVDWGPFANRHTEWRFTAYRLDRAAYPTLSDEIASPHSLLGFAFGSTSGFIHGPWRTGNQYELTFPQPALFLIITLLLYLSLRPTLRRRSRLRRGLCPTCAYDLRAHSPGDKCPECGTTVTIHPTCAAT